MGALELQNLPPYFTYIIIVLEIWDLYWRGKALWKAAQNKQNKWFIALLIVNSLGILPIIYLKFYSNTKKGKEV